MRLVLTVIYVIFYNSIFELIEVSTQKPRCFTTYDSPNPLKACIFPFKFRGQTYTGDFNFLKTFMNLSWSPLELYFIPIHLQDLCLNIF